MHFLFFKRQKKREQKITEIRTDDPLLNMKLVELLESRESVKLTMHDDVFYVYAPPKSIRVLYERRFGLK